MVKKKNIILIISIVSISIVMMIGGAFSSSFQDPQSLQLQKNRKGK